MNAYIVPKLYLFKMVFIYHHKAVKAVNRKRGLQSSLAYETETNFNTFSHFCPQREFYPVWLDSCHNVDDSTNNPFLLFSSRVIQSILLGIFPIPHNLGRKCELFVNS